MIGEPEIPIPERRPVAVPTASATSPAKEPQGPIGPQAPVSLPIPHGRAGGGGLPRLAFGKRARNGSSSRRCGVRPEPYVPPLASIQASPNESHEEVEYNQRKHPLMLCPVYHRLLQAPTRG